MKLSDMLDTVGTSPHETLNPSIPQQMTTYETQETERKKRARKNILNINMFNKEHYY